MFNPKVIAVAACVGFVLSFFSGLFSGIGFGFVLLRALGFAVVFGLIAVAGSFVFNKFLNVTETDTTVNTEGKTGSVVDITIGENDLPKDENDPVFYVDNSYEKENLNVNARANTKDTFSDVAPSNEEFVNQNVDTNPSSFEPLSSQNVETINSSETKVASTSDVNISSSPTVGANTSSSGPVSDLDEELDDLPDFNTVVKEVTKDTSMSGESRNAFPESTVKDADVMAQAIRTMLSKDS